MIFNDHSELNGTHAFLSPSKHFWINYSEEKLIDTYYNAKAAQRGTETHEFAALCIKRGQRLPEDGSLLSLYVNDAIDYKMTPEVCLYFSPFCYGFTDTIMYRRKMLRIHDLKTGVTKPSMDQLRIYAALFFLEYKVKPELTKMELRIYQGDEVLYDEPDPEMIREIMDIIVAWDKTLEQLDKKAGGFDGR